MPYWPTQGFRKETPEKLGFDATALQKAVRFSTPYARTQAVLVIRHGYLAAEEYAMGFTASTRHESYSVAKSFSSGLVGIAMAEGKLSSTDELICKSYPSQWNCADKSDRRSRITLDHVLNLKTGLMWQENWHSKATGPNDALSLSMLDTVLARPATEEPGQHKRYSTGDPALLSGVLGKATGMTALAYAKQKVFDIIGTPGIAWNSDFSGRTTTYAGLQATATEFAKYGYLYLRRGQWDGKQVIPEAWVDRTTRGSAPCEDWNQYLWHINLPVRLGTQDPSCTELFCPPTALANLPADGYFAEGVNGQFIFVIPSADLVVVRLGNDEAGSEHWDEYARGFLEALLDALR
jgi:CubicO group peptidase (beta-lactamase class C family)